MKMRQLYLFQDTLTCPPDLHYLYILILIQDNKSYNQKIYLMQVILFQIRFCFFAVQIGLIPVNLNYGHVSYWIEEKNINGNSHHVVKTKSLTC